MSYISMSLESLKYVWEKYLIYSHSHTFISQQINEGWKYLFSCLNEAEQFASDKILSHKLFFNPPNFSLQMMCTTQYCWILSFTVSAGTFKWKAT